MNLDWRELCKGADLEVINTGVRVCFADGRSHRVTVENRDDEVLAKSDCCEGVVSGNRFQILLALHGVRIDQQIWLDFASTRRASLSLRAMFPSSASLRGISVLCAAFGG